MGKLEPFSELLAGRYSYYGEVEPTQSHVSYPGTGGSKSEGDKIISNEVGGEAEGNNSGSVTGGEECDENFGEIIKKSMVETVSA